MSLAFLNTSVVSQLISNVILPRIKQRFPGRGIFVDPSNPVELVIQDSVDQLREVLSFIPIESAGLNIPTILYSYKEATTGIETREPDLFLNPNPPSDPPAPPLGGNINIENIAISLDTYEVIRSSIAGNMQISSSALGTDVGVQWLTELEQALMQLLQRFLSISIIYGGYSKGSPAWKYYSNTNAALPSFQGWDQSVAFDGLYMLSGTPSTGKAWSSTGFTEVLNQALSLQKLNEFLATFKGANNGRIDYLVMNSTMFAAYLNIWNVTNQQQVEFKVDPKTGHNCAVHNGIPIIINDYIIDFDPSTTTWSYLTSTDNPEYTGAAVKQTSIYALNLGQENNGIFGFFPSSFGDSPLKIEREMASQTKDSIILRGMIEAGLAYHTGSCIGRLAAVQYPTFP